MDVDCVEGATEAAFSSSAQHDVSAQDDEPPYDLRVTHWLADEITALTLGSTPSCNHPDWLEAHIVAMQLLDALGDDAVAMVEWLVWGDGLQAYWWRDRIRRPGDIRRRLDSLEEARSWDRYAEYRGPAAS